MNIELPRDAEGLEIPLDTVALYDDSGNVHSIRRFIYTNDFDLGDKWINSWVMVVDDYKTAKPEQMHLTNPDSLKQLNEDLSRAANFTYDGNFSSPSCAYANHTGDRCGDCKFNKLVGECSLLILNEVASRVNRLAGGAE